MDRPTILVMTINEIEIKHYPIKLGQFLKHADIVQDGLEAKFMILDGEVEVNGEVERRRGRKLQRDDLIVCRGRRYRCG